MKKTALFNSLNVIFAVTATGLAAFLPAAAGLAQTNDEVILQEQGTLQPAQGEYQFRGRAGQVVAITLTSADFDPYLVLLDPSGEEIASNDDYARSLNSTIVITLPTTGRYKIEARSLSGQPGTYSLSMRDATPYDQAYSRGLELIRQQKYEEAIAVLNEAVRLDAKQPSAYLDLADAIYAEATRLRPEELQGIVSNYERAAALYEEMGDTANAQSLREQLTYLQDQTTNPAPTP